MYRKVMLRSVLFILTLNACRLGQPAQFSPQDQTETAIAFEAFMQATLLEAIRQTEQAGAEPEPAKATLTPTLVPDSATPEPTDTPDERPIAIVKENTNCRSGPAIVFKILHIHRNPIFLRMVNCGVVLK